MRRSRLQGLPLAAAAIVVCLASDAQAPLDLMLAVELAALILIGWWFVHLVRFARSGAALARALDCDANEARRFGVAFRRLQLGGSGAFALGFLAPRIYLSADLERQLDPEELRGILLHEDHHRRTLAPLRGAALLAWLAILGRIGPARRTLAGRLAHLECSADAHALARGVAPSALASALLKTATVSPIALAARPFGDASDTRVAALLGAAEGNPVTARSLPIEWAPVVLGLGILVLCHLVGVTVLG